jgi:flavin-dependent dehydrogenase
VGIIQKVNRVRLAVGTKSSQIFAIDKGIRFETNMPDMAVAIVNDDAAVKGYSYLLVTDGYGCICTVLFDEFHRAESCFQKTMRMLENTVDLDIRNPKKVGGIGSFSLAGNYQRNQQLFVGEAAGLQDLLWGFGIRSAIKSGHLAATSIIEGLDYAALAGSYFEPKLKASLIIRYLYEKIGSFGYSSMLKYTNRKADPIYFLYNAHRFTRVHKLIFPLARYSMRKRYHNLTL